MKGTQPYLNFDGQARDAMTFYQHALGGKLDLMTFGDAHIPGVEGHENRVMHARLETGPLVLMASDTMPGHPFTKGNNFHINIDCSSNDEQDKLFAALSEGGKVTMPLADQFWGARFGMLTDRYGVSWMFNSELPKK
jgi:PhnB protein